MVLLLRSRRKKLYRYLVPRSFLSRDLFLMIISLVLQTGEFSWVSFQYLSIRYWSYLILCLLPTCRILFCMYNNLFYFLLYIVLFILTYHATKSPSLFSKSKYKEIPDYPELLVRKDQYQYQYLYQYWATINLTKKTFRWLTGVCQLLPKEIYVLIRLVEVSTTAMEYIFLSMIYMYCFLLPSIFLHRHCSKYTPHVFLRF